MGVAGMAVAGAASSAAGSALGNAMDKQNNPNLYYTPSFVTQMNGILQGAMTNAIGSSTNYTNQAVGQQNTSLNAAQNAINSNLGLANQAATNSIGNGLSQSINMQAPYANAGYAANDAYMDSLGLSRPQVGGQAVAQALQNANNFSPLFQAAQSAQQPGAAPTAPNSNFNSYANQVTPAQIAAYVSKNTQSGVNLGGKYGSMKGDIINIPGMGGPQSVLSSAYNSMTGQGSSVYNNVQQLLEKQAMQQAQSQYQTQQGAYQNQVNAYNTTQSNANNFLSSYSPQQQQIALAYQRGMFGG